MSETVAASDDVVADLEAAHAAYEETADHITDHGESEVRAVAAAHDRATTLLDRYDGRATGTGDFEAFIEFQEAYESFVDDLDDDLPHRDAFETTAERFDKRRLSESDFAAARETLAPAGDLADLLAERDARAETYRDARRAVDDRLATLDDRLDELERIHKLGDADLDAPVADLREPIAAYDDRVAEAFATFEREASAREFLGLIATTERYPLVAFASPPAELREYVETTAVGSEPVPTLIEYADYSPRSSRTTSTIRRSSNVTSPSTGATSNASTASRSKSGGRRRQPTTSGGGPASSSRSSVGSPARRRSRRSARYGRSRAKTDTNASATPRGRAPNSRPTSASGCRAARSIANSTRRVRNATGSPRRSTTIHRSDARFVF